MAITRVDVPGRVFVKAVLTVLLTLVLIGFFEQIATVVVMFALALIITAVLDPVVAFLERHHVPRGPASMLSLAGLVLLVVGLLVLVVPPVVTQGIALAENLPNILNSIRRAVVDYPAVYNAIERQAVTIQRNPGAFFSGFLRAGVNVVTGIATALLILTLALYILIDKQRLLDALMRHTPVRYHDRLGRTLAECSTVVRAYFAGQGIVSLLFAIYAFIVLMILGVPFAIVLTAFAFVLDAIPNIGLAVATIIAAITALATTSPTAAIIIVIAFQGYNLIENNLISPRILGNKLKIPPVLTLLAILVGGQVLGVIGVFLAIPLAGMLPVIDRIWVIPDEPEPESEPEALPRAAD